jgi:hypothetical protein
MRHEGKIAEHGKIEEAKYGDSKNHSTEQWVQESAFCIEIKIAQKPQNNKACQ